MAEETKFCSNCGEEIDAKAEICPNCGVRVKSIGSGISGDKPTAAFVLSLIAGVLIVIHDWYMPFLGRYVEVSPV